MSEVKVVAVTVVHKTIEPGKPGNKLTGQAAVKPKVQVLDPGTSFMHEEGPELDRLLALGAVRYPEVRESFSGNQSNLVGLLNAEAGRDADEIYREQLELREKENALQREADEKAAAGGGNITGEIIPPATTVTPAATAADGPKPDRAAEAAARRAAKKTADDAAKKEAADKIAADKAAAAAADEGVV